VHITGIVMTKVIGISDDSHTFETLRGSADDVRKQLKHIDSPNVVALALNRLSPQLADEISKAWIATAALIVKSAMVRQCESIKKLVDAIVPWVVLPPYLLTDAIMQAEARTAVL